MMSVKEGLVLFSNNYIEYDPLSGEFRKKVYEGMYPAAASRISKAPSVFSTNSNGYLVTSFRGKLQYLHRLAAKFLFGEIPEGSLVDHIDGNRSNNRADNLRIVSPRENAINSKAYGVSKYRGVFRNRDRWTARIENNGKRVHLGTFDTEEEARDAYQAEAKKLHGDYMREKYER